MNIIHLTLVKIWDYNRSETDLFNRSIESFDWSKLFSGKNVHERVGLFKEALLNIFHNFTPNEVIVYDDRDPPWVNDKIKKMIKKKKLAISKSRKLL